MSPTSRSGAPRPPDPAALIRSQVVLEEHDISRDGAFAVVVRRFVAGNRYRSHLWLVPLESTGTRAGRRRNGGSPGRGAPRQLTTGRVRDTRPRISPNGRFLAFRRASEPQRKATDADETSYLFVLDVRTGRERRVPTPRKRAVNEIAWSPDGSRLAFTAEADPPRFTVGRENDDETPTARRIRRIDWRLDEAGIVDRWEHAFVVGLGRGAQARQLTHGDFGVSGIAWSPDGARLAFAADRRADSDLEPRTTIWAVDVGQDAGPDGRGEPRQLLALGGSAHSPAFSPDGRWLAAVGVTEANASDDVSPVLVVAPADGAAASDVVVLDPDLDRPIGTWVDTDLHGWTSSSRNGPFWADDATIVAMVSVAGRSLPWRFGFDGATRRPAGGPTPLVEGDAAAYSLAVAPASQGRSAVASVLVCIGAAPLELATVPVPSFARAEGEAPGRGAADGPIPAAALRPRTRLGSQWSRAFAWPQMRLVSAPGDGGPIDTWIASPPDAGDRALPTVVDVHGGPLGAWAPAPSLEVVLLCARGFRVVLPNIRGSQGYGRAWIRPQLGDWGGVDAADVHAALDHAVALGLADPERVGVLGLSYGGFMANWLVGTTDRFRAAVSENGVANQVSAWANSDVGVDYNRTSHLGAPLDRAGMEKLWAQSPLANVANVRTPLLMLQAEADRRCPPSDNEQLFIALRVLGRTVEFVLYPEEFHVYHASGRPDRRIDRMERLVEWFERYLLEAAPRAPRSPLTPTD